MILKTQAEWHNLSELGVLSARTFENTKKSLPIWSLKVNGPQNFKAAFNFRSM